MQKTDHIKIGILQQSRSGDTGSNMTATLQEIRKAAETGANIICLQELFLTRYFCFEENYEYFTYAEAVPGKTTGTLQQLAKELNIVIIASLF